MNNIFTKSVLVIVMFALTMGVSAHRTGHKHKHRHGKTIIVKPGHHHHPIAGLAALAGLAIVIDAAGNAKTESGQEVIVLESPYVPDGKTDVIEHNGKVYIIK